MFPAVFLVGGLAACAAETPAELVEKATAAYRTKDYAKAIEYGREAVKADPKNADAVLVVGLAQSRTRHNKEAVASLTKAIELNPKAAAAYDARGDANLKLGKFAEAVADFDKYLAFNPTFTPEHWRRGIALYYAGKFKEGKEQFETHKTANPQDVENAAWHYLCNAKVVGKDKARAELIDVTKDTRVPMAEIQKLFAGKLKPEDVLAASEKVKPDTEDGTEARFYGHLYVALFYEAEGDAKKVRHHLTEAVEKYKIGHYMWDVADAHLRALRATKK
jgi:lipoprotein NlpI